MLTPEWKQEFSMAAEEVVSRMLVSECRSVLRENRI